MCAYVDCFAVGTAVVFLSPLPAYLLRWVSNLFPRLGCTTHRLFVFSMPVPFLWSLRSWAQPNSIMKVLYITLTSLIIYMIREHVPIKATYDKSQVRRVRCDCWDFIYPRESSRCMHWVVVPCCGGCVERTRTVSKPLHMCPRKGAPRRDFSF